MARQAVPVISGQWVVISFLMRRIIVLVNVLVPVPRTAVADWWLLSKVGRVSPQTAVADGWLLSAGSPEHLLGFCLNGSIIFRLTN